MGRLIDADKLKHAIHCAYSDDLEILEKIDEQPTAFDAEKVTESLMDRFRVVSNDEDLEWNRAIDYAIKIVEGGGAE
jgi:hypothetical protein|nr:MAG TPA: hypothetical protein [Caudoviricetes sp.]